MKTLKNFVVAALMCSYLTNCQNPAPTPDTTNTNVVVTPPTPTPTNKCDNVKNPLEDIQWIKDVIKIVKDNKIPYRLTQYTYRDKIIYYGEQTIQGCNGFSNCDRSITTFGGNCGGGGASNEIEKLHGDILKNAISPILLFEQK